MMKKFIKKQFRSVIIPEFSIPLSCHHGQRLKCWIDEKWVSILKALVVHKIEKSDEYSYHMNCPSTSFLI